MTALHYKALDARGRTVAGVMEADDERQVRQRLREQQLKPLSVTPAASGGKTSVLHWPLRKLPVARLALLMRQMASLVKSGVTVDEALRICGEQGQTDAVKALVAQVRSRVLQGQTLAMAMSEHPGAFDRTVCAMVKAGESSGFLAEALERLALHAENSQHTRQKLQTALIYPVVLLGVSLAVVVLLMSFVVPRLVAMFASSQRELPALTQGLITVSDFVRSPWAWLLLIAVMAAVMAFRIWLGRTANRLRWHQQLLKVPGIGGVLLQMDSTRLASTLSILLGSGVPLVDALRIAAEVQGNQYLRDQVLLICARVQEGGSFSKSLQQQATFPPMLAQMAANGEANGTLSQQLAYAASWQERDLSVRLGTVMALLEPMTIVLMGGLITVIMLAVLLPVFEMSALI
ncbi:MAG TPA: type II secretion system F family protein [Pseudohongiella sp.]|nr:type II secretion system F family protein [Pseudohongiella sp.]